MKLVLDFFVQKKNFPLEYRKVIMHFLKRCVDGANNGKYYEDYYKDTKTKNFTFSVFFDNPSFEKDQIKLASDRVKVVFSTSEQMTGFIFYSSFLEKKNKKILLENDNNMVLKNVTKVNEVSVNNNKILVKMGAPLAIRLHNRKENKDRYYSFDNEKFSEKAKMVIDNQLKNEGFNEEYINDFKIIPIKCNKVIVKHYDCKIEASLGNFLIEGNPAILDYLIKSGIGSRRSEGFGMMELLTQDI